MQTECNCQVMKNKHICLNLFSHQETNVVCRCVVKFEGKNFVMKVKWTITIEHIHVGKANVTGCSIYRRPHNRVNWHLEVFRQIGKDKTFEELNLEKGMEHAVKS